MSKSLDEVLVELRQKANDVPHVVKISLMIHSQAKRVFGRNTSTEIEAKNVYYGYGALRYFPAIKGPRRGLWTEEYLESTEVDSIERNDQIKVINDINYSTDESLRGYWGEFQSFLVKAPASDLWKIHVDPKSLFLPFFGNVIRPFWIWPPRMNISTPGTSLPSLWVDLTDDNGFLRGIGQDPIAPNEKALFALAFGEIEPFALGA